MSTAEQVLFSNLVNALARGDFYLDQLEKSDVRVKYWSRCDPVPDGAEVISEDEAKRYTEVASGWTWTRYVPTSDVEDSLDTGTGLPRMNVSVDVVDIIGSDVCVSCKDGIRVNCMIMFALDQGLDITLSFKGVRALSPAFLDTALRCLCNGAVLERDFGRVHYDHISPGRMLILQEAIKEGREYYRDPDAYRERMKEFMEDY